MPFLPPMLLQSDPPDYLSQGLLLVGLAFVTVWLLMRVMRRRRDPAVEEMHLDADERHERVKQARGLRGDLESVMVEVEEMARRFAAQIDAKSIALDRLIDKADARITELKALERKLGLGAEPAPDQPKDSAQAGDPDGESQLKTDAVPLGARTVTKPAASANGQPSHTSPDSADAAPDAAVDVPPAEDSPPTDSLARSIYRLADAGHDAQAISRLLSEHVGKIELILALRRTK